MKQMVRAPKAGSCSVLITLARALRLLAVGLISFLLCATERRAGAQPIPLGQQWPMGGRT
jgi:hypothetical protein